MSRFYLTAQADNRKTFTRTAHKEFYAHIRGWNKGIKIWIYYDQKTDTEIYEVSETKGSNNSTSTVIKRIEHK